MTYQEALNIVLETAREAYSSMDCSNLDSEKDVAELDVIADLYEAICILDEVIAARGA